MNKGEEGRLYYSASSFRFDQTGKLFDFVFLFLDRCYCEMRIALIDRKSVKSILFDSNVKSFRHKREKGGKKRRCSLSL